jgi:protein TonB
MCEACQRAYHGLFDSRSLTPHSSELHCAPPHAEPIDPTDVDAWHLTAPVAVELGEEARAREADDEPPHRVPDSQLPLGFDGYNPLEEITGSSVPEPVAVVPTRPPSRSRVSVRWVGLAAAVVAIAAIGFPLRSLWRGEEPALAQPRAGGAVAAPQRPPKRADKRPPASPATTPAASAARAATPSPSPTPTAETRVQAASRVARPTREAPRGTGPVKPAAPPVKSAAAVPAPTPAADPAPPAAVTPAPAEPPPPLAEAPAPAGPFYETRDVTAAPQVVSRVEPGVPAALEGSVNDVVVVRVLVSQTGNPSLVRLLRGSRSGAVVDEAVVAAVKQWTFTPARRRGEAVSCWYHVGVPIRRTE